MRLFLLNAIVALGVALALFAWPAGAGPVVIFAASADVLAIVAKADGRVIGAGPTQDSLIAISDRSDFVPRLYSAGARLVAAAQGRACGSVNRSIQ